MLNRLSLKWKNYYAGIGVRVNDARRSTLSYGVATLSTKPLGSLPRASPAPVAFEDLFAVITHPKIPVSHNFSSFGLTLPHAKFEAEFPPQGEWFVVILYLFGELFVGLSLSCEESEMP